MTALFEEFYQQGLQLNTKVRSSMKNKLLLLEDKLTLRKRAVVESINDILTSVFDLEHTRHRSSVNAMAHMLAALTAYCFYDSKPSIFLSENQSLLKQYQYSLSAQHAIHKNARYVWLGVWEKNPRAISFYRKNGFVEFDKHIFKQGNDEQIEFLMKLMLNHE